MAPVASAAATPVVSVYDTFAIEDAGSVTLTLALSEDAATTVSVNIATTQGTATAGADYLTSSAVIEFAAGTDRRSYVVQLVDDAAVESQESLTVTLSSPSGATIGQGSATVVIVDDEGGSGTGEGERDCTDGNTYTTDTFDAAAGYCKHVFGDRDLDNDGTAAAQTGGPDCNDTNAAVEPGVAEVTNGIDDNCDGLIDGASSPRNCSDNNAYTTDSYASRQGYCRHNLLTTADLDGDGSVAAQVQGADCNDADASVKPGATEVLGNGKDDNCDGIVDSGTGGGGALDGVTPVDIGSPADCPATEVCESYVVGCEGIPLTRAVVSRAEATGTPRGVAVIFSGGDGDTFLGAGIVEGAETVDEMQAAGLLVLRVAWPDTWVTVTAPPYGLDTAACRSATLVDYFHAEEYVPLGLDPAVGVCGFCVGGNSAGATQTAYSLTHYGQDDIIDAAVMSSGPILAALSEGCLTKEIPFKISKATKGYADLAYGYTDYLSGPCVLKDQSMKATWDADSILHGGSDYFHPETRIEFLIGGEDTGSAPGNAAAYADVLISAGSPFVTEQFLPTAGHGIADFLTDPAAQAAFVKAFTG